jgi:hypothetical protein
VRAFPALYAEASTAVSAAAEEGEAACFDHPAKQAIAHCSQCGRFLCALCSVEFRDAVWCPSCLESASTKRKIIHLETHRTLYDSIALALAILPVIAGFWPSIVGAPAALYVAIRYWRAPGSIVRRTKIRYVAAAVLACVEMAAWAGALLFYFTYQTPTPQ